ncbi:hypothetical protein MUCCIDRAFT_155824 [Mucor lusitanicus CBS 277.49]|uniref:Uncharacterized protein n=2 Tax=Mucor circinelloides f. lusitanicus TaxID=29924 RepID=A0A168MNL1_MUCCL|nr:hypothetical protein MUCCIDRAFT_155824 [Mucor lusitanicus CBS 277.49]
MSTSNLAVIFIPTLNIGRALFHCMVEHYQDVFEGIKKSKAPPPPLPQKPRNLSISSADHSPSIPPPPPVLPPTNAPRRIFHAKTMSDTDLMKKSMNATTATSSSSSHTMNSNSTPSPSIKIPPPKPSRSPATHSQQHLPPRPPRAAPPVKPRSKSMSSPHRAVQQQQQQVQKQQANSEEAFWKQRGRVEAIGKQFETLMNSNVTMTSPTSFSASSSSLRK